MCHVIVVEWHHALYFRPCFTGFGQVQLFVLHDTFFDHCCDVHKCMCVGLYLEGLETSTFQKYAKIFLSHCKQL